MMGATQTFDAEKFAKVRAMMDRGATEGERAAARTRAEAMAQRAGMTLKQAMSKMDRKAKAKQPPPPPPSDNWASTFRDIFRDIDDEMERKYPGYKAREAAKKAKRATEDARKRAEAIEAFGSAAGIFELTDIERALYEAATPFAKREWGDGWIEGRFAYTRELGGQCADIWAEKVPAYVQEAIRKAWPMPETIAGLMEEARMWDDLSRLRGLFVDGEYYPHQETNVREWLVKDELDNRPATSWDDVEARFAWALYKEQRQWMEPSDGGLDPFEERLQKDFRILRAKYEHQQASASQARRTNADKRRDVLSMMDAHPELSDREISRRCCVSPQTVSNWRAKTRSRPEERNAA